MILVVYCNSFSYWFLWWKLKTLDNQSINHIMNLDFQRVPLLELIRSHTQQECGCGVCEVGRATKYMYINGSGRGCWWVCVCGGWGKWEQREPLIQPFNSMAVSIPVWVIKMCWVELKDEARHDWGAHFGICSRKQTYLKKKKKNLSFVYSRTVRGQTDRQKGR
jgi:hypothetical protein